MSNDLRLPSYNTPPCLRGSYALHAASQSTLPVYCAVTYQAGLFLKLSMAYFFWLIFPERCSIRSLQA